MFKKKSLMSSRKGFFYIIDAVIAFVVLVIGVVLILSSNVAFQSPTTAANEASDFFNQITTLQVKQVSTPFVLSLRREPNQYLDESYNDVSILQAAYELHIAGITDSGGSIANQTIKDIAGNYVLDIYNIELYVGDQLVYSQFANSIDFEDAAFVIVQRQLLLGQWGDNSLLGPYIVELRIW